MSSELAGPQNELAAAPPRVSGRKLRHVWVPLLFVAAFWLVPVILKLLDFPIYAGFFTSVATVALLTLAFTIWWLAWGGGLFRDRALTFLSMIAIGVVVSQIIDKSVGGMGFVFFGVPMGLSVAVVWLLFMRTRSAALRNGGMLVAFAVVCGSMAFMRIDGIDGDQKAAVKWRWSNTSEDLYLASRTGNGATTTSVSASPVASPSLLVAKPGDWAEFRGPGRLAEVRGVKIATDWQSHPPKQMWRQRIGPAWSSMLVLGDRLFTQEQRGEMEAVVCLDAETGREIWAHEYKARFSDGQAGAGPRSSPAFSDSRIYAFGASGILSCVDASNGKLCWSRDVVADSAASVPMWGFSSSPLVVDGLVVVYAGGKGEKGLLAYRDKTGEPAWSAETGPVSYSSPQLATVHGQRQILFLSDTGLVALEPVSGKLLWQHKAAAPQIWRVALPRQIDDKGVVIGSEDLGLVRIELAEATPTQRWDTRALRPAYNDFVSLDGFIYGFDEGFFCCVDAATGKRRWKAGRYGHGQVLLLAEQRLLLVIAENGEAVLVSARPDQHEELGRFQAVNGKTWNHPAIARGFLYVRNAEEIACYKLATAK